MMYAYPLRDVYVDAVCRLKRHMKKHQHPTQTEVIQQEPTLDNSHSSTSINDESLNSSRISTPVLQAP